MNVDQCYQCYNTAVSFAAVFCRWSGKFVRGEDTVLFIIYYINWVYDDWYPEQSKESMHLLKAWIE